MRIDKVRTQLLDYLNYGSIVPSTMVIACGFTLEELSTNLNFSHQAILNEINYLLPFGLIVKDGSKYYSSAAWKKYLNHQKGWKLIDIDSFTLQL